jgi:Asp-tRNA(Asn)/Glu-tRNA(Gln) amidotransferase A subunit family amidase
MWLRLRSRRTPCKADPTRDEHDVSNTCGIPAVAVPHGFTSAGNPTSVTFHGRLYNESGVLA